MMDLDLWYEHVINQQNKKGDGDARDDGPLSSDNSKIMNSLSHQGCSASLFTLNALHYQE